MEHAIKFTFCLLDKEVVALHQRRWCSDSFKLFWQAKVAATLVFNAASSVSEQCFTWVFCLESRLVTKYFSPTLRFLHLLKSKCCSKINNSLPLSAIRENLKSTHTAESHISLSCVFFFFDTATYQPVNTFVWLCRVSLPLCYTSTASFNEKTKKRWKLLTQSGTEVESSTSKWISPPRFFTVYPHKWTSLPGPLLD